MSGQLVEGMRGWVDWKEEARKRVERIKIGVEETLDNPWLNDPRIHHVRYQDFVADPVGTIGKFYAMAGVPFGPEVEGAMRDYLKNNKADRYGKFKYSTDIINADIAALHEEFKPYRERFGIDIEQRHG